MTEALYNMISEFGGGDKVKHIFAPGLDAESFTDSEHPDKRPMFVTLPIIKVGEKSANGLVWQRSDAERVVSEINEKRVEGNLGHTPADKRATDYKLPVLRWIGAVLGTDGVVQATAHVPDYAPDVQQYFRDAKRVRARVGTSVYGMRGKHGLSDMTLESIDIGHPDRISLKSAAAVPVTEFELNNQGEGSMSDESALVSELRTQRDDATKLVTELRSQLATAQTDAADLKKQAETLKLVSEVAGVASDKLVETVRGLVAEFAIIKKREAAQRRENIIAELVCPDAENRALPAYKRLIGLVGAQVSDATEDATITKSVMEYMKTDDYQFWAQAVVSELAGPSAFRGTPAPSGKNWRDELVKNADKIAKEMGVS